jgi:hypothetical protein
VSGAWGVVMSEPLIASAIGFAFVVFLAVAAFLLARRRARRTAVLRLPATPLPIMTVIETDMDLLHSQIAVATRRLEICVDQMKARTTTQLAEIGKTSESVGRLRAEMTERTAALVVLQDKEKEVAAHLRGMTAELAAKGRGLAETEQQLADRKAELARVRAEIDVHPELARVEKRHAAEVESLKAEKAAVESALTQSREECIRLHEQLESTRKQVETTWASERMANAVLRERINDVASEVVRVAVALEGLNSPIDSLVAGKSAEVPASTNGTAVIEAGNGGYSAPVAADDGGNGVGGNLIHRIQALRQRSARLTAPT